MDYIDNPKVLYSHTDSIFTTKPLDNKFVGKDLGLMKDELEGNIITEGYLFGIKQYCYFMTETINNKVINNSLFAGVERDSFTLEEIISISKGKTINKYIYSN